MYADGSRAAGEVAKASCGGGGKLAGLEDGFRGSKIFKLVPRTTGVLASEEKVFEEVQFRSGVEHGGVQCSGFGSAFGEAGGAGGLSAGGEATGGCGGSA